MFFGVHKGKFEKKRCSIYDSGSKPISSEAEFHADSESAKIFCRRASGEKLEALLAEKGGVKPYF